MSLLRSGFAVASFTLLSRIFGLLRELCLAQVFGASNYADCINVALKLPNLFRRIFSEGALAAVFVPLYSKKRISSPKQAEEFTNKVFCGLLYLLVIFCILMQLFMPQIMLILAPGFTKHPEKFQLAVLLSRITMPYLIFISLSALIGGVMNTIDKFKAFAATPIILNVGIIIGCYIYVDYNLKPIITAIAILVSGIAQLAFMYYSLRKEKISITLTTNIICQDTKYLLKQMGPATLSNGIMQINLFISNSLASFIDGAVSILSYAERLYQLPLSLIGTTFSTIMLPNLSKLYSSKDITAANKIQEDAIKLAFYISTPCSIGIYLLATEIITLIYQRGAFNQQDVLQTALCLKGFSIGLIAFILNKIFTPSFYANNDQHTPFKITAYSLAINIVLNIIFMQFWNASGIAIGSSIAAWINTFLLYYAARNKLAFTFSANFTWFIFKVACCNIIMLICLIISEALLIKLSWLLSIKIFIKISSSIFIYLTLSFVFKIINFKYLRILKKHF